MAAGEGQSPTKQVSVGWRLWLLWVLATTSSGFLFGSVWLWMLGVGFVQWLVLRRYLPHCRGWVLTHALGWVVGAAASGIGPFTLSMIWGTVPGSIEGFRWVMSPLVSLTLVGALQWRILRQYLSRAGWWVLATVASWYLTIYVNRLVTWAVADVTPFGALLGTAVMGATTGAALVWLFGRPLAPGREA